MVFLMMAILTGVRWNPSIFFFYYLGLALVSIYYWPHKNKPGSYFFYFSIEFKD
jgi:hypothetical protein